MGWLEWTSTWAARARTSSSDQPLWGSMPCRSPARQGTRLVEHNGVRLGEGVEVARPLDQDSLSRRAADAAEVAQGDAEHECARAGYDEEDEASVDPFGEGGARDEEGRDEGDQ